jgi:hypothetical protein
VFLEWRVACELLLDAPVEQSPRGGAAGTSIVRSVGGFTGAHLDAVAIGEPPCEALKQGAVVALVDVLEGHQHAQVPNRTLLHPAPAFAFVF